MFFEKQILFTKRWIKLRLNKRIKKRIYKLSMFMEISKNIKNIRKYMVEIFNTLWTKMH